MKTKIAILAACASTLTLAQADVARAEIANIPVGVAYKNGQRTKANNPSLGKVKTYPSGGLKTTKAKGIAIDLIIPGDSSKNR